MSLSAALAATLSKELPRTVVEIRESTQRTKTIQVGEATNSLILRLQANPLLAEEVKGRVPFVYKFCFTLCRIPDVWIDLFIGEHLHSPTSRVELGDFYNVFLKHFLHKGTELCGQDFAQVLEMVKPQFNQLLQTVNILIGEQLETCKEILRDHVKMLKENFKRGHLNKYMIFKLMKEISQVCHSQLKQRYATGVFEKSEPDALTNFVRMSIKKYQTLTISGEKPPVLQNCPIINLEKDEMAKQLGETLDRHLSSASHLKRTMIYGQAERAFDHKKALLVEVEDRDAKSNQFVEAHKYLVFFNNYGGISIMNGALITKKWYTAITEDDFGSHEIKELHTLEHLGEHKEEIIEMMLDTAPSNVENLGFGEVECLGESLGEALAHFHEYDSIAGFIEAFLVKTAVGGALYALVSQVPLLGSLFELGGFSLQMHEVLASDYRTNRQKFRGVQEVFVKQAYVASASIVGGIVGQILVPIPVVGFFLGGLICGYFAEVGWENFLRKFNGKKYAKMRKQIMNTKNPDGSWDYNPQTLDVFGIKEQYFLKSMPEHIKKHHKEPQKVWMTLLCFCILSEFESMKDKKTMTRESKRLLKDSKVFEDQQQRNKEIKEDKYEEKQVISGPTNGLAIVQKFNRTDLEAHRGRLQFTHKWTKAANQMNRGTLPKYVNPFLDHTLRYLNRENVRFIRDLEPALEMMLKSIS